MADCIEKHQLAGLDARERGFNRVVELERVGTAYRAVLRYETAQTTTEGHETESVALQELIRQLHACGYAQLRSQLSFRGNTYFGNREPWIEYPDPERVAQQQAGILSRLLSLFHRG
ncbi:MAG: hypothetical protein ACREI9_00255 [Nitrospiraceae bacterium]